LEQLRRLRRRLEPRSDPVESGYGAVVGEDPTAEMEWMGVDRRREPYTRRTNVSHHDASVDELRRAIEAQVFVSGAAPALHDGEPVHIVRHAPSIGIRNSTRIQAALLQERVLGSYEAALDLRRFRRDETVEAAHR
jgi:hypothetical protein